MKQKWLVLLLLLGGVLMLVTGCNIRTTDTPAPPLIPAATQVPAPVPTVPVGPQGPTAPPQTAAPPPDLVTRPEMTVRGNLESGIPFGVTSEGHAFKGDPQAPVLIIEFSDYQ